MATEIAAIAGLIELKDDFTSQLGISELALQHFSEKNQESLKAVAEAAGLIAGAIVAVTGAVIALGVRGSDIADVDNTLEHFAGSAEEAEKVMAALRAGTKGTVDNFLLAKDAAHLLSAGVKLTADDFGTLGQAAFVLQNRGLGGTKEQLDLVSDALVTGRTRALAMALGVVDAGDAEEKYAKTLGITKDELSDTGKVQAKRIEIMRILNEAVKDAGVQERDFKEELEAAKATLTNWLDNLAKAIAVSPVFAAGLRAIESAVADTFGGDSSKAIDDTIHFIEQAAIVSLDFAQDAISMAKAVESAWYLIKTGVLATETVIVGIVDALYEAATAITAIEEKVHLVPQGATQEISETRDQLRAMTADLAAQTAEAAAAVVGHTALDDTLDSLSGKLSDVQKAMIAASTETHADAEATDVAAESAKKLAAQQEELNNKMIDNEKVMAKLTKSTAELSKVWDDYFALVAKASGTAQDEMQAQIEATFNKQVDSLDALDPLFKEKYAAYRTTADEALSQIGSSWGKLRDQSREASQQAADAALADYDRMLYGSLTFSRDALDAQKQHWMDLRDAAREYGQTAVAAQDAAKAATEAANAKLAQQAADLQKIRQLQGGSMDVTSTNFQDAIGDFITSMSGGGALDLMVGRNLDYTEALKLAKAGYSFADIIGILTGKIKNPGPPGGPRIPGFAEGGTVMVGEEGPEVVRLPLGATVYPTGMSAGAGNGAVHQVNNFYVNGTALDVARKVSDIIMSQMKLHRQFGSA